MNTRQYLEELAWLYEVSVEFFDIYGNRRRASDEALLALLPNLGAELSCSQEVESAVKKRRLEVARQMLEPVVVVWDCGPSRIGLRLPQADFDQRIEVQISLEDGGERTFFVDGRQLEIRESWTAEGLAVANSWLPLGEALPWGYHRLRVRIRQQTVEAMLIVAPTTAWQPERDRYWGIFTPLYALHDEKTLGVASLRELSRLIRWTHAQGGALVGTLPLMASFMDTPCVPSPYSPVSRLFWNELYLDVEALPEFKQDKRSQQLLENRWFQETIQHIKDRNYVDFSAQMHFKREMILPLVERGLKTPAFQAFVSERPEVQNYAAFRAMMEDRQSHWRIWQDYKDKTQIDPADVDPSSYRYHLYVQHHLNQQLSLMNEEAQKTGLGLYLDMPLGVHPGGYDAWSQKEVFLQHTSAGAPPDALFTGGQNWGFHPLHPHALRQHEYGYVIDCAREQMRHAGALRIDHVLGLHRIFTIPHGMGGDQGLYVNFRPEEMYAITTLESHRNQCMVVGEDLGTIPNEVRQAMDRHKFHRMYLGQFSLGSPAEAPAFDPMPRGAIASLNTHDTPSFKSFWEGHDIRMRVRLGHIRPEDEAGELRERAELTERVRQKLLEAGCIDETSDSQAIFEVLTGMLADSSARLLLINLDDLLGSIEPQNIPGTIDEYPNWRSKQAIGLDQLSERADILDFLHQIAHRRHASALSSR